MNTNRSRWAAIGAAVAVTLGAGGIGLVSATSPSGATAYVPIEPCRAADTRPGPENVGPRDTPLGAAETHAVSTGDGNCAGDIPGTATGVQLNVTALGATLPTFVTIWGAGTLPTASNLNPVPDAPPTPNAVTSGLDGDEFNIYNFQGNVNVIVDIVGYYTDHNHDDRYYQKSETYTQGEVDAGLADKADSADVYTQSQADARFVNVAPVQTRIALSSLQRYSTDTTPITYFGGGNNIIGNGKAVVSLTGPRTLDGRSYQLDEVTYCLASASANRYVTAVELFSPEEDIVDATDRQAPGCYTVEWDGAFAESHSMVFSIAGSSGSMRIESIVATWTPTLFIVFPVWPILPPITLSDPGNSNQGDGGG